jgi:hypothetical protein
MGGSFFKTLFAFDQAYDEASVTSLGDFSPIGRFFADWAIFRRLGDC